MRLRVTWAFLLFLVYGTAAADEADEPTPAQLARSADTQRTIESMRGASDRLAVLFSRTGPFDLPDGERARFILSREGQLRERTRGSTDPALLMMLAQQCTDPHCDRESLVRRWVAVDLQNQAAWIALAEAQRAKGRVDEANATTARAADAPSWRNYRHDIEGAARDALPRDLTVEQRADAYERIASSLAISQIVLVQSLHRNCTGSETRAACRRIYEVAFRDADDLATLAIVQRASADLGIESTIALGRERDAYITRQGLSLAAADLREPWGPWDADDARIVVAMFDELHALGERAAARVLLRRAGVSDDEAYARERHRRAAATASGHAAPKQ